MTDQPVAPDVQEIIDHLNECLIEFDLTKSTENLNPLSSDVSTSTTCQNLPNFTTYQDFREEEDWEDPEWEEKTDDTPGLPFVEEVDDNNPEIQKYWSGEKTPDYVPSYKLNSHFSNEKKIYTHPSNKSLDLFSPAKPGEDVPPLAEMKQRAKQLKVKSQFYKTQYCRHYDKGKCFAGDFCTYAHNEYDRRVPPDLYKTKICPSVALNQPCEFVASGFGVEACPYAHCVEDLRCTAKFYRTSICRFWKQTGECRMGDNCRYAHGEEELRANR